jgi:hypothetical protein
MLKFKPKKDLTYGIVIWLGPALILPYLIFSFSIYMLIVFCIYLLLAFWIWNSTNYAIENEELLIKCWVMKKRIKISEIESVRKTKNNYSSYCLSAERLGIKSFNAGEIYIAPLETELFLSELQKTNSEIKMN